MAKSLAERVGLVTGASRGIGRAIALKLASEGAHVIATARTVGGLEELDDEISAAGGSATLVPLDIKDFEGIDRLGTPIASQRWRRQDLDHSPDLPQKVWIRLALFVRPMLIYM